MGYYVVRDDSASFLNIYHVTYIGLYLSRVKSSSLSAHKGSLSAQKPVLGRAHLRKKTPDPSPRIRRAVQATKGAGYLTAIAVCNNVLDLLFIWRASGGSARISSRSAHFVECIRTAAAVDSRCAKACSRSASAWSAMRQHLRVLSK